MPQDYDILIKQAHLRDQSQAVDIGIENGKISALAEQIEGHAELTIDAQGNLVTESFVNPHLHLCKVYTRQMMDEEALTVGFNNNGREGILITVGSERYGERQYESENTYVQVGSVIATISYREVERG